MTTQQCTPTSDREYRAMLSHTNMIGRAVNLHTDGYSLFAVTATTNTGRRIAVRGQFVVVTPKGDAYTVNPIQQTCQCVCFHRTHCCKHLKGLWRLGCQQANATMQALFPRLYVSPETMARYMEAKDLLAALEDCKAVCQARMRRQAA